MPKLWVQRWRCQFILRGAEWIHLFASTFTSTETRSSMFDECSYLRSGGLQHSFRGFLYLR